MLRRLIREIRVHRTIRKIFRNKENLAKLRDLGFDIDWIGRIYGVVPVDTELLYLPERNWQEQFDKNNAIDTYIKDKLIGLVRFFNELEITNLLLYPEYYEQFDGTNDFLVVLEPEHKFYSVPKMIGCCGLLVALGVVAVILAVVL